MNYATKNGQPFPLNLLEAIFGEGAFPSPLPKHTIPALYYLAYDYSERGANMTFRYYRDGKTYSEIAAEYSLTTERIRQIIAKVLRVMRHPKRQRMLQSGVQAYFESRERAAKDAAEERAQALAKQARQQAIADCRQTMNEAMSELLGAEPAAAQGDYSDAIELLDLSVRSFNCLHRAGVNTVGEIIALGPEKLMRVRNLGKKSYEEIVEKLVLSYGENRDFWKK